MDLVVYFFDGFHYEEGVTNAVYTGLCSDGSIDCILRYSNGYDVSVIEMNWFVVTSC